MLLCIGDSSNSTACTGEARLGGDRGSGGGCGRSVASAVPDTRGGLHGRLNGRRCKIGQQLQHASPNHKCCHHICCCCLVAAAAGAAAVSTAAVPALLLLLAPAGACACHPCPHASSSSCFFSGCLHPEHQHDAFCQLMSPCCTNLALHITQPAACADDSCQQISTRSCCSSQDGTHYMCYKGAVGAGAAGYMR